jgi:hypothetical protein
VKKISDRTLDGMHHRFCIPHGYKSQTTGDKGPEQNKWVGGWASFDYLGF